MQQRRLGSHGPLVSALGLGAMGMSGIYGATDDARSEATVRRALDLGVTLIDTADFYGSGHNEMLLGRALRGRRDEAVLSVKFGVTRTPDGGWGPPDGRPAAVKNFATMSLRRLGTDVIDLYTLARVDPSVPIEETVGAIGELIAGGYVRYAGLSEAGPDIVRRAQRVVPLAAVQIEYSLWTRDIEPELLPVLRELGIAVVAYSPLSRGLLGGTIRTLDDLAPNDFRRRAPRYQGENLAKNLALVEIVRALAAEKGITPAQLAIAWVLSRGEDVVPIPGTRDAGRLAENLAALDVRLGAEDLRRLDEAMPPGAAHGERYAGPALDLVYKRAP